jgi:hypothetical protein
MDPESSLPYSQQPAICPLSTTKQRDTQIVKALTVAQGSSLVLYEVTVSDKFTPVHLKRWKPDSTMSHDPENRHLTTTDDHSTRA